MDTSQIQIASKGVRKVFKVVRSCQLLSLERWPATLGLLKATVDVLLRGGERTSRVGQGDGEAEMILRQAQVEVIQGCGM